jgi:predicted dehydrogenase
LRAADGGWGGLFAIDSWWFNDWLRRPRLAEELDESHGAGFILRQAPHLVDIACYIAGFARVARSRHDRTLGLGHADGRQLRSTDSISNPAPIANLSLNGYGYFDTSELTLDIGNFRRQPRVPAPN